MKDFVPIYETKKKVQDRTRYFKLVTAEKKKNQKHKASACSCHSSFDGAKFLARSATKSEVRSWFGSDKSRRFLMTHLSVTPVLGDWRVDLW
jgi:hypothetical protein